MLLGKVNGRRRLRQGNPPRHHEQKYGGYRTKRVVLEIYDAMAKAIRTDKSYRTLLDPSPADPRVAYPSRQAVAR